MLHTQSLMYAHQSFSRKITLQQFGTAIEWSFIYTCSHSSCANIQTLNLETIKLGGKGAITTVAFVHGILSIDGT